MDEGAIEDTSPAVVGIQAQVEQLAQKAPALGLAVRQGMVDRDCRGLPLFKVGDELAKEFLGAVELGTQRSSHAQVVGQGTAQ